MIALRYGRYNFLHANLRNKFVILYYVFNNLIDFSKGFTERIINSFKTLKGNEEFIFYIYLLLFSFSLIFVNLLVDTDNFSSNFSKFSHASFQTVSLLTVLVLLRQITWNGLKCQYLFFYSLCLQECAGSTTGGIKIVRIMLLFKALKRELILVIHPRAVIKLRIGDKV